MIIRVCERKPLTEEERHDIRNNLLVVYGKLKRWKKDGVITEEEYVLCHDRLCAVTKTFNDEEAIMSDFFTDLWTVKMSDWMRGLIIAILTTPLTVIYDSVTATPMTLTFNWKMIIGGALAGGIGYILKNFITGNGGQLLRNTQKVLAYLIIPLMLLGALPMYGCPALQVTSGGQTVEPWYVAYKNWTNEQKAGFFMELWMQQEADYKTMNAYPNKTEALIKALTVKREVLEQSRVPLRTYVTVIKGGGAPDAAMEQQIVGWLTTLQMNYLTGGK